jgi:transcriptional regulator with XRE-family HTH domain
VTYAEALACVLATRRDALGMTGRAFGRHCGGSHNAICQWGGTEAREPALPSLRVLLRIATALGTTPAGLLAEAEALLERDR